jgi:hypothetical protein
VSATASPLVNSAVAPEVSVVMVAEVVSVAKSNMEYLTVETSSRYRGSTPYLQERREQSGPDKWDNWVNK